MVYVDAPAAVAHVESPLPSERQRPTAIFGTTYVTAVIGGQVIAVPRASLIVGADGSLTLPVQEN